jgi:hypothetical protein
MRWIDEPSIAAAWHLSRLRRMTSILKTAGLLVNCMRLQRLMRLMGIAATGPKAKTSACS